MNKEIINEIIEVREAYKKELNMWRDDLKKEMNKGEYKDYGYVEACRENIADLQGRIEIIDWILGLMNIKEGGFEK